MLRRSWAVALCAGMLVVAGGWRLRAQDGPPEGGGEGPGFGGGRSFLMGGNSAHGTVTAISGGEISVRDEQGQFWKVLTGPNTHFRKDREEAKIADIHPGDVIVAAGNLDETAKSLGAFMVMILDPQQAARMEKMRADFGKTWTAGRVTAIKDLTLTIERPDKVAQTLAVDENTSFQRRSRGSVEDITFPDIKVGDMVNARGALKGGDFLATTLMVMQFQRHGPHRPLPQPEGAPTGAAPAQPPTGQEN
jgi:hypothetical protein